MSYITDDYDLEKQASARQVNSSSGTPSSTCSDARTAEGGPANAKAGHTTSYAAGYAAGSSFSAKVMDIAGKLGVEQRGIERVPEDERTDTGFKALLNVATMWFSANMVVAAFALGLLAKSVFGLGVADAMLVILFFNLIGITPVCIFSTFGPRFGLRQMVLSRFWFGWYGVKLIAFFNVLACLGWSSVNSIVGAQLIQTVNPSVPGGAGIAIIAVCTFVVCTFGYKIVHYYEFVAWIPPFIVFLIILGVFAHSGDFVNIPWEVGTSEMGSVLSFGSVIYGFATGWTSYAADYTVYQPATQSRRKVFLWTWLGLIIPLLFTQMLAVAVMSATTINSGSNRYQDGYDSTGTGGLIGAVLVHLGGFGDFCMIILALSIIANNAPNIYSVGLTAQVLARKTAKVPRFVWTAVGTGIYIAIAIPGYSHFEDILKNFMNFIGYWLAIYEGIALCDHFVFRRSSMSNYNPDDYDHPEKLPPGYAAVLAFCFGLAGMVTGMSQEWYVGPIALHAGDSASGGDVGFEQGFAFAFVAYLILRPIELRYFGR